MRPVEKPFVEATTTPSSYGRGTVSICRQGKNGSILVVAINRLKVKNALNDDVYEDLIGVLERAKVDSTLSAVIWTAAGSYFSSGADVREGHLSEGKSSKIPTKMIERPGGRFMLAVVSFPKVFCAAVQGPAVGIAATALMHCDLVYFGDTAYFWAPFSRLALGELHKHSPPEVPV